MEEADVLSDRICVIVDGSLKCIGTSLFLKNQFGDGYRITIISNDAPKTIEMIKHIIPSATVIDCSGGSIMFGISLDHLNEMVEFVKIMESEKDNQLKNLIEDWGLSLTTLEEVFMRVTGKKHSKLV